MQEIPTRPRPQSPKQKPKSKPNLSVAKMLSTRGGTMGLAAIVALIGAAALLVFIDNYRDSVDDESKPITVLVAKDGIGKGTSGDVIASETLFETTTLPQSEVKDKAITDPSALRGQVAVREIFPGQQLTAGEFVRKSDPIGGKLTGYDRAISVPVDANHGLIGRVDAGDRVDILAGFNAEGRGGSRAVLRTLVQDVLVLEVPEKSAQSGVRGTNSQGVVVRVDDQQAAALAYASEYGKVWIVLRPPAGARQSRPPIVSLSQLLTGLKPIALDERRGGDR